MSRSDERRAVARAAKGFMPDDEGDALTSFAMTYGEAHPGGTWLEIGAWCGKSAVYLGIAAEATQSLLYSLDHHHGSEENQAGWEHFDRELVDPSDGRLNTLPVWQRTIATAGLEGSVVGLVGDAVAIANHFAQPLDILFIDGGHGEEPAWNDYRLWTPKIQSGGLLFIHDVFPNPDDGGRPPFEIYCAARESGLFTDVATVGSLRILQRL